MTQAMTSTPGRFIMLARDIKLSHSIFALPFALLAMFLAAADGGQLPSLLAGVLIVVCMVLARTMAMAVNRWADSRLDADNPRTAGRAIPSGRLAPGFVLAVAGACAVTFIAVASVFWVIDDNPWPPLLAPLVLAWLCLYSFTKRFTWLSHLFLGSALALSPVATAIAVRPVFLAHADVFLLALMVMCWVAGFDVIYALQDVEVDREQGLHSMPSRLGVEPALWISRGLHVVALSALVTLARLNPHLSGGFIVGAGLVAGLLALEHALVWRSKTHHIHMAFFTINGVISVLLGALGVLDVVVSLVRR